MNTNETPSIEPEQIESAKQNLRDALKHFRYAIELAAKEGTPKLSINAEKADGSGRRIISFECENFFADLALVCDAGPMTQEDRTDAMVMEFAQMLDNAGATLRVTPLSSPE